MRASPVVQWLRITCQCRAYGPHPWPEELPHAIERLGPRAATSEVAAPRASAPQQEAIATRSITAREQLLLVIRFPWLLRR